MKIQIKAFRIITLSGYNSLTQPLFKQLNLLKIEDQLKLQELKFYFNYIHRHLPVYLLNWQITPNVNVHLHDTRKSKNIHTARTKHELAKKVFAIICHIHALVNLHDISIQLLLMW